MTRDTATEPFDPNRAGLDLGTELLLDPPPQAALPDLTAAPVGPDQALRGTAVGYGRGPHRARLFSCQPHRAVGRT